MTLSKDNWILLFSTKFKAIRNILARKTFIVYSTTDSFEELTSNINLHGNHKSLSAFLKTCNQHIIDTHEILPLIEQLQ